MQTKVIEDEENIENDVYKRDKIKSENFIFTFDIIWFILTGAVSLWKFDKLYVSSKSNSDVAYFVLVFAMPILIKHFLRISFFQTLSEYTNKYIVFFYRTANTCFAISGFYFAIIFLLLSNHGFVVNELVYISTLVFHIVVILLGLYDKIMVRLKPKKTGGN
ncbi:hypothetical protein I580_01931 [Enterococcus caccae ATCC BAA-1240]|uniref:Uncharacterized protein n=1 Tax=Enterococcus caccae ATCC BAA-1240 TaxID=1158612 RepID=R3TXG7_9ENTE|nr:hypothetical protein UC7_01630 [Enterococcus caccae ATCC BAA-1240]EOT61029.1 hypothetical protein I580_01931 [Enterococcus caccae ATCC BAA-1240]OJG27941.1 hypothetical protein RU98_GL002150 [Enterococcus caccae]